MPVCLILIFSDTVEGNKEPRRGFCVSVVLAVLVLVVGN